MVRKIKASKEEREAAKNKVVVEEPDEFLQTSRTVYDWMSDHSKLVLTVAVVLFVGGLAYSSAAAYGEHVDAQASDLLAAVLDAQQGQVDTSGALKDQKLDMRIYATQQEKDTAIKEAAQVVLDAHSGHQTAAIAGMYMGKACLDLDDFDCAVGAFEKSVKILEQSDPLRNAMLLGLAAAYEAKGDVDQAIKNYQLVADGSMAFEKDQGLFHSGRMLLAKGDKDMAKSYLERIDSDFPESSLRAEASSLLQELK